MGRPERFLRLIAALLGLAIALGAMRLVLREEDPRARSIVIVAIRLGYCGTFSFVLFRRAAGKKMGAIMWAVLAMGFVGETWKWKGTVEAVVRVTSVGVAFVAGFLELRQERAAQPRVAADRAAPGR